MNYKNLAKEILQASGNVENIAVVNHCATRLRLTLNDNSKIDENKIKSIKGVMGLVTRGKEIQVVIGTEVGNVYNEFVKLGDFKKGGKVEADGKKNIFGSIVDFISGTFVPVLPILVAAGLVSAILNICVTFFGLSTQTGTYVVLNTINNAGFFFLPIYVGYSAAKKIGINPMMGAYLAAILVHSNIDGKAGLDFFGIPITQANYNTSVVPIILGVLFMSIVDKGVDKITPKEIKFFAKPLITILIVTPVTLIALGPLGIIIGNYVASALNFINVKLGWLSVGLIGAFTPFLVMTGMNQALFPLVFAAMAANGYDAFVMPGMLSANVAVGAASLAVSVKSRNKDVKALALSSGITGVLGITEPSIFGVLLRFKRPFIGAMIGGGIGGLFAGIVHLKQYAIVSPGLAALPTFIPTDGSGIMSNFYLAVVTVVISIASSFIASYFLGFDDPVENAEIQSTNKEIKLTEDVVINSPIKGIAISLKNVKDEVFSNEIMGKGVAIIPEEGVVYSPINGEVSLVFNTKHAIGITSEEGIEILIHIGLDTVKLGGEYFNEFVKVGDKVSSGDKLLEFDLKAIKDKGYDITSPIIISNSNNYSEVGTLGEGNINMGETLMVIS
ncbi:MAG: sugar transporter [Clostridiaceae bacterium]|nr:sugar transporter [Clostridiaceae bacterium]